MMNSARATASGGRLYVVAPESLYSKSDVGYRLMDWRGETCIWPRRFGEALGQTGAYNLFFRLGYRPHLLSANVDRVLAAGDCVVLDIPDGLPPQAQGRLREVANSAASLILFGDLSSLPRDLFDVAFKAVPPQTPYNCFALQDGARAMPLCPAGWPVYVPEGRLENWRGRGEMLEIFGDRISPLSAGRRQPSGSAVHASYESVDGGRLVQLVNGRLFSALQAWLQGQEDLIPWLGWADRQNWLDDYVEFIVEALFRDSAALSAVEKPDSNAGRSLSIRHDNDDSVDFGFLEQEASQNARATYAVLDDGNREQWLAELARNPQHENALHYTTIAPRYRLPPTVAKGLCLLGLKGISNRYVTGAAAIGRGRLRRQVAEAKRKGIGTKTLHRHFAYLPYPEYVDALDSVMRPDVGVVGSISLFRAHVYRWGSDRLDGEISTVATWPDVQFPYWFPFRIAHAGDRGRMLQGWEGTLMLEPEPEFVDAMLHRDYSHIRARHISVCYHPSNTSGSRFLAGGTRDWLRQVIDICGAENVPIMRCDELYDRLNTLAVVGAEAQ